MNIEQKQKNHPLLSVPLTTTNEMYRILLDTHKVN